MKNIAVVIVVIGVVVYGMWILTPPTSLESYNQDHAIIDENFSRCRKVITSEKYQQELFRRMGVTLLDKQWIYTDVDLQKPLLKNWTFRGRLRAKVFVEKHDMVVYISQFVNIRNDGMIVYMELAEPTKFGIQQSSTQIRLLPRDDKTYMEVKTYMFFSKKIPFFAKDKIQTILDSETAKGVSLPIKTMIDMNR